MTSTAVASTYTSSRPSTSPGDKPPTKKSKQDTSKQMVEQLSRKTRLQSQTRDILESYSLVQTVSEPTRVGLTNASPIDLIICSQNLSADSTNIDCCFTIYLRTKEPEIIYYRDIKLDDFTADLDRILFQDIFYTLGVDNKRQLFNSFIIDLFDKDAPIRQVRLRKSSKPWVTDTLKILQPIKDKYLRKLKRSREPNSWQQYKEWRN
nr:unnamed protein product [Callosobruchus analis]